jgi:hypothetical protein
MMTQQSGGVQLRVAWGNCTGGNWCQLNSINLSHDALNVKGVYIIWHGATKQVKAAVVYVGQGVVRDRLADHRDDARIQAYADRALYVTWAAVQTDQRDGVEAYLSMTYAPLVGERRPAATPISVNSPWG